MARHRRTRPANKPDHTAADKGTPESQDQRERRGMGTMDRLITNKRIGPEHQTAAQEIEAVYAHLCGHLFARGGLYGERMDKSYGSTDPAWFRNAWTRYKAWRTDPSISCAVVLHVLVDGWNDEDLQNAYGLGRGHGMEILIDGLHRYCELAGWAGRRVA